MAKRLKKITFLGLPAVLFGLFAQLPTATGSGSNGLLNVAVIGQPEIVFNWATQRCGDGFVPDAPARAFRTASGQVRLFATSTQNWALLGSSLMDMHPDCQEALAQERRPSISDFNDLGWIEATYTKEGIKVAALVSDEWSGYRHRHANGSLPEDCDGAKHDACVYYAITEAVSVNGGETFTYKEDNRLVAAAPEKFIARRAGGRTVGDATVSNIVAREGYEYVFIGVRGLDPVDSGACLLRTTTPFDPSSWRAWDGRDFSLRMIGAYNSSSVGVKRCAFVSIPFAGPVELRSVEYAPALGKYIGLFQGAEGQGKSRESAIFFTTSDDLVRWTPPMLIMSTPKIADCKQLLVYPSLLDPSSTDRNFETISTKPFLYLVRFNRNSCRGTLNRDLIRIPLRITY